MTVTNVPTDQGRLYAYRDHGGREIICGVAVYGVDPEPLAERLIATVKGSTLNLQEDPQPLYTLSGAKPGRVRHFGSALAPGLEGALIVERAATTEAPSLEADFQVVLVQ